MREIKRFSGVGKTIIALDIVCAIIWLYIFPKSVRRAEGYYGYGHIYRYTISDYFIMALPYISLIVVVVMILMIIMQLKSTVIVYDDAVKINALTGSSILNFGLKNTILPFTSIKNVYAQKQGMREFLIIDTGATSLKVLIKGAEEAAILINQLKTN